MSRLTAWHWGWIACALNVAMCLSNLYFGWTAAAVVNAVAAGGVAMSTIWYGRSK